MIFFDVTKAASAGHHSGLNRVSSRLLGELGSAAIPVVWSKWDRAAAKSDWFLTAELFSESERPGFRDFLLNRPCRCAAIFYDAIPLQHPHITWPQSVARHPDYMKLLASFDQVLAISASSRSDLLGYWQWLGLNVTPPVTLLSLGADADRRPRWSGLSPSRLFDSSLLCLGILEPRKNQSFLLDVCAELWAGGLRFDLHLVGRANPHFGGPILAKIKALRKKWPGLHYHAAADDAEVARLFAQARASVCPTIAEGGGLPLLESLWKGVPCLCSDLPSLRESAAGGGCLTLPVGDSAAWKSALSSILTDDPLRARLTAEAMSRPLATWAETAAALRRALPS